MNYPKAIIIGAALIAGAMAFSIKTQANPLQEKQYQIIEGEIPAGEGAIPVIWRLDVKTGQVVFCLAPTTVKDSKVRGLLVKCIGSKGHLPSGSF